MGNFLSILPTEFLRQFPDWQNRAFAQCPILATALNYANNTGVEFDNSLSGSTGIGEASFWDRRVSLEPQNDMVQFFHVAAHEIKHISQRDKCAYNLAWHKLEADMRRSAQEGKYLMAKEYVLPSIVDSALMRAVTEYDAHAFGGAVYRESLIAFRGASVAVSSSEFVATMHEVVMNDKSTLADWIRQDVRGTEKILSFLLLLQNIFGEVPVIKWGSVDNKALIDMTLPLWEENGAKSPFAHENGSASIDKLRDEIAQHPDCIRVTVAYQEILGVSPPSPAARLVGLAPQP